MDAGDELFMAMPTLHSVILSSRNGFLVSLQDFNGKYSSPKACAEALGKVIADKSALIVDCAAGTGRVGQEVCQL